MDDTEYRLSVTAVAEGKMIYRGASRASGPRPCPHMKTESFISGPFLGQWGLVILGDVPCDYQR